jgi:prolyl-tRNA synthetase
VEFKLASNSKLAQNLAKQVEIYKKAHDTDKAIKVILFFSVEEEARARKIIADLGLSSEKYIVLIDARSDNKLSASRA